MRFRVEERDTTPPFWLFWAGLLLALLLVFALHLAISHPSEHFTGLYYDTARMMRPADNSTMKVVAVGASLIGCGLALDGEMESLANQKGMRINFTRLTQARWDWWVLGPLLTRISQRPPDVLVIEAELLAWQDDVRFASINSHRLRMFNWILTHEGSLLSRRPSPSMRHNLNMAVPMIERQRASSKPGFDPEAYSRHLSVFRIRKYSSMDELIPILRVIQERGCIVVILPMGRSPAAAAMFPPSLARDFAGFLEYLSTQGFVVDRRPIRLPQECYADAAHMNKEGQRRASMEFLTRLPRWIEAKP